MSNRNIPHIVPILTGVLVIALLIIGLLRIPYLNVITTRRAPSVIVIDPGHGGYDPGKVSADQILEKDINLAIALKLKKYLEAQDCIVYMTRDSDISLCSETDSGKKQKDMRNRIAFIEETRPDLMISIHQNSYPSPDVRGAQVFYYHTSDHSEYLASCVQSAIVELADPDDHRTHKANDSYYILKNVSCPSILVECGFLSCPSECALLSSEEYQEIIAFAIASGVRTYLNTSE